jgi:hypothetical protein
MVSTLKKKASENAPGRAFAIAASMSLGQIATGLPVVQLDVCD